MKKKMIALLVFCFMLLNTVGVFAADGDVYTKTPLAKKYSAEQLFADDAVNSEVGFLNPDKYYYEYKGKLYTVEDANAKLNEDQNAFPGNLMGMTAIDVPQGLQIESVELKSKTEVLVKFNGEIDAAKLVKANFTILDKNSAAGPVINTAVASVKEGKSQVTLGLGAALTIEKAPYTLFVNKAVGVNPNTAEIAMAQEVIKFEKAVVQTDKIVVFTANVELDTTAHPGVGDITIKDMTDPANVSGAMAGVAKGATDKDLKVTVTNGLFFQDGHQYKVTVAAEKLVDKVGNKNEDPYRYEFTATKTEEKPKLTKVTVKKSKVAGQIVALLEFDMDVTVGVNAGIQVVDKVNSKTHEVNANTIAPGADASAEIDGLTSVPANQVVLKDIMAGAGFEMTNQKYTFKLLANQVTGNNLAALKNEELEMEIDGVDIEEPEIVGGSLNADGTITVKFNEKVVYKNKEVTFEGFDAEGTADDIVAVVTLAADGKSATLKPETDGEIFGTGKSSKIKYAEGTFVDESGNKIAAEGGAAIPDVVDNIAAKPVKAVYAANVVTITFTEKIAKSPKPGVAVLIDGADELAYNAGEMDERWWVDAAAGTVKVKSTSKLTAAGKTIMMQAQQLHDDGVPAHLIGSFSIKSK